MVQAHDHVGCETCLDALIDLEARVDALEQPDRARRRDEAYRAMVDFCRNLKERRGQQRYGLLNAEGREALDRALALARQVEE